MLGAKVNVLGTLAVFETAKALGDQVKRIVYASSEAVFGGVGQVPGRAAALCAVLPEAAKLVTFGTTQIAIAYDLSDDGITRDLGPMPKTSLTAGIRETVEIFQTLRAEGRLDTADLDGPKPAPVTVVDEV
ncbi:UDP-glucose 4-epimerase [Fimbriiglobus ruber]|uniref:UDP-glucose 4-epimerase n=2 Tax=Fimbriiglobus ruber TaxID=1908690 RepID=A0A225DKS7_9BACT|nr:UDP-glucose 4-epimerase [Fimbriiglobus ruber]